MVRGREQDTRTEGQDLKIGEDMLGASVHLKAFQCEESSSWRDISTAALASALDRSNELFRLQNF